MASPTFLRSGKNGGASGVASPVVVTVTGNAGEIATLHFCAGYAAGNSEPVPTITGGGVWTKRGASAIVSPGPHFSIATYTNDGTAFTSLSVAFTNAPDSVVVGVRLDSGVSAIGNTTTTTVLAGASYALTLTMQEALNELVVGWNGDDGSTPRTYSAGASTNLRDQLPEPSGIVADCNWGMGDRSGGPGSLTATLTTAGNQNAAGSAVELRGAPSALAPVGLLGSFFLMSNLRAKLAGVM
jgi:hypothetical protein